MRDPSNEVDLERDVKVTVSDGTVLLEPKPVKVHVQGEGGTWRDLDDWPPPSEPTKWHLHPGGRLALAPPGSSSEPDRYR